jgi:DnaA family protein
MLVYHLASLNDDEKKSALQLRASQRGFELNDAVASYIMTRAGRSFDDLMKVLDALDNKTLETQRRLSIPLVRETLEW